MIRLQSYQCYDAVDDNADDLNYDDDNDGHGDHGDHDDHDSDDDDNEIIPSQMEVAPLHCTVDIRQKRRLFKNTKEIEKM